jgi:predicted nucleotidyltransferase
MKPESFKQKLYIPRNVEGEPNEQELIVIRELEKRLAGEESFVGLAPFGSVVNGYSLKDSDFDFYILCDWPKGTSFSVAERTSNIIKAFKREKGIEMHFIYRNVNPELVLSDLEHGIGKNNPGEFVGAVLAEMSRLVTGKKINQYRKIISEKLRELPAEQKQELAISILDNLASGEALSLFKRSKRIGGISKEEHLIILEERKEMWRKRVAKIWNL